MKTNKVLLFCSGHATWNLKKKHFWIFVLVGGKAANVLVHLEQGLPKSGKNLKILAINFY